MPTIAVGNDDSGTAGVPITLRPVLANTEPFGRMVSVFDVEDMIPYSNGFEHRLLYDLVVVLEVDAEGGEQKVSKAPGESGLILYS